jgi:hypothetical protein
MVSERFCTVGANVFECAVCMINVGKTRGFDFEV